MIRLNVVFIGIFLVWLWLLSPFVRRTKMIVTLAAMVAAAALIVWETYDNKPREGLVQASQLSVCGVEVTHTYRTDYNVDLCLVNNSSATVKRIHFLLLAQNCTDDDTCTELATVTRDMPITINAGSTEKLSQTLRFDALNPEQSQDLSWTVDWLQIKAIP